MSSNIVLQIIPDIFVSNIMPMFARSNISNTTCTIVNNSNILYNSNEDSFLFKQNNINTSSALFYNINPHPCFSIDYIQNWNFNSNLQNIRFGVFDKSDALEVVFTNSNIVNQSISVNYRNSSSNTFSLYNSNSTCFNNSINQLVNFTVDNESSLILNVDGSDIFNLNLTNFYDNSNNQILSYKEGFVNGSFGFNYYNNTPTIQSSIKISEVNINNYELFGNSILCSKNIFATTYDNLERQIPIISLSNNLVSLSNLICPKVNFSSNLAVYASNNLNTMTSDNYWTSNLPINFTGTSIYRGSAIEIGNTKMNGTLNVTSEANISSLAGNCISDSLISNASNIAASSKAVLLVKNACESAPLDFIIGSNLSIGSNLNVIGTGTVGGTFSCCNLSRCISNSLTLRNDGVAASCTAVRQLNINIAELNNVISRIRFSVRSSGFIVPSGTPTTSIGTYMINSQNLGNTSYTIDHNTIIPIPGTFNTVNGSYAVPVSGIYCINVSIKMSTTGMNSTHWGTIFVRMMMDTTIIRTLYQPVEFNQNLSRNFLQGSFTFQANLVNSEQVAVFYMVNTPNSLLVDWQFSIFGVT